MPAGIVKWFDRAKGYGFIIPEVDVKDRRDVFVHHRVIRTNGFQTLSTGQIVDYEAIIGPRGPFATEVRI